MYRRLFLNGLLFASIFFLPWWVPVSIAILIAVLYAPYEIIPAGFMLDALYYTPAVPLGYTFWFTTGALLVWVVQYVLKKQTFLYHGE